ncbi:MAG TPA: FAD-dependent oxidoreductase, partial [Longimicrobiales bacterium]|nr:FAD-dependent oxidoreductase [Longimicrobiales bacterium]
FKKNDITHVAGFGRLAGEGTVEVEADGETRTLQADHVILATGSRPRSLPFLEIDEDRVLSSTGALQQKEAPGSLLIVGAGAIGMEFADIFEAYGSQVTIVEALDRVLPLEDEEVSAFMARAYKKRGMDVFTSASLESAEVKEDGVHVEFHDSDDEAHAMVVDRVLLAVGRAPNTDGIGLDTVGIETDDAGFVQVDDLMRTGVEGVYAVGDCAGRQLLAHKASHEGIVCVEHIAGEGHHTVDYDNVPN